MLNFNFSLVGVRVVAPNGAIYQPGLESVVFTIIFWSKGVNVIVKTFIEWYIVGD